MTFGRSLVFSCAVLSLWPPATLRAEGNATPPETVSFAYFHRHPVRALPESAIDSFAAAPESDRPGTDMSFEPPPEIGVAPARRLSRNGLCNAIASAARANDLPVSFLANLIWQESNFDAVSISRAGAQGIAQFMPRTAVEFGLFNPFEPIHAVFTAGEFLRKLFGRFGNLGLAAAAYNAGPKRVSDWLDKRGELPGETRNYVQKITGRPADAWTSTALSRGPEASLMPARAPCSVAAEEVETQKRVVRVAHLISELAAATRPSRVDVDDKPFDEQAWAAATGKPGWQRWAVAMAREVVQRIRKNEKREIAAHSGTKAAHAVKIAQVPAKSSRPDKTAQTTAKAASRSTKTTQDTKSVPSPVKLVQNLIKAAQGAAKGTSNTATTGHHAVKTAQGAAKTAAGTNKHAERGDAKVAASSKQHPAAKAEASSAHRKSARQAATRGTRPAGRARVASAR